MFDNMAYSYLALYLVDYLRFAKVSIRIMIHYSQLSANGHSRKRTALLADTFLNSRFYLPVKLCI